MSRFLLACLFLSGLLQIPATPAQPPGNNTSAAPITPTAPDPATVKFASETGVLLIAVKPDKTADYEAAIVALQDALSKSIDPDKRALAEGWRVYKATELDAKTNAIYLHFIQPTVADTDYRVSLLLDELLAGAPAELLAKYREAFAAAPAKLALAELAHMSVAPVPKPSNASPAGPDAPATPGNVSPAAPGNASPTAPVKPGNTSPPAPGNASPPAPKKPPGAPDRS